MDIGCFEHWYKSIPTVYDEFGGKIEAANKVKQVVSVPVSCDGKLDDPVVAQRAIESGMVDYVGLGKQSIADANWPNKVKKGQFDDIRYCIGCNECLLGLAEGRLIECAVNPRADYENFSDVIPTTMPQNLLIIGDRLPVCRQQLLLLDIHGRKYLLQLLAERTIPSRLKILILSSKAYLV